MAAAKAAGKHSPAHDAAAHEVAKILGKHKLPYVSVDHFEVFFSSNFYASYVENVI
jgi:hypothetical protein